MVQVLEWLEKNWCLQRAVLPLCLRNHQRCGCSGEVASRSEPSSDNKWDPVFLSLKQFCVLARWH